MVTVVGVVYVVTAAKAVSVVTVADAAMLTAAPAPVVTGLAVEVRVGLASAASLPSAALWNAVPDAALTDAVPAGNVSLVPQSAVTRNVATVVAGASARRRKIRNAFVGVLIRLVGCHDQTEIRRISTIQYSHRKHLYSHTRILMT